MNWSKPGGNSDQRLVQKYVRCNRLIMDELGYVPFAKE